MEQNGKTSLSGDDSRAWLVLNDTKVTRLDKDLPSEYERLLREKALHIRPQVDGDSPLWKDSDRSSSDEEWKTFQDPAVSRSERQRVQQALLALYNALFNVEQYGKLRYERVNSRAPVSRVYPFRECMTYWIVNVYMDSTFVCEFAAGFMWDDGEFYRRFECHFEVGGVSRQYRSFNMMVCDLCTALGRLALASKITIEWGLPEVQNVDGMNDSETGSFSSSDWLGEREGDEEPWHGDDSYSLDGDVAGA